MCVRSVVRVCTDVAEYVRRLKVGKWFGLVEVDIEIPRENWERFEEIPDEAVPQKMKDYLLRTNRPRARWVRYRRRRW